MKGQLMRVLGVRSAKTTYPTGNPNFAVKQAFPAGFNERESDPFLMCDYFGPSKSKGRITEPDKFDVPWHPHRGMDICTYLKEGVGRHADSMGNREQFATPGMQWISVGSGIEHAEGGGTEKDKDVSGFQIWVNVPAKHKMDDPQYGVVEPNEFPLFSFETSSSTPITARVLAGELNGQTGPFRTKQALQMIDYVLPSESSHTHQVPLTLDNCIIYVYAGSGSINNQSVEMHNVVRLDAADNDPERRSILLSSGSSGMSVMYFAGKRLNEPIAWHGPFVMNTEEEIQKTFNEYRSGEFPPKRVPWDYKKFSSFPEDRQRAIIENFEQHEKLSRCL